MNRMSSGDYSSGAGHGQVKKCGCPRSVLARGELDRTWKVIKNRGHPVKKIGVDNAQDRGLTSERFCECGQVAQITGEMCCRCELLSP